MVIIQGSGHDAGLALRESVRLMVIDTLIMAHWVGRGRGRGHAIEWGPGVCDGCAFSQVQLGN